ncbi:alpha/beta hydrolase [Dasania sp. GY-MA-18]|uniref:Alpha/beta hydrolase n=1 Tax=Dasania phycosphaerae TaxID=2950436 RepID=A0A9J6RJJ5_9GAMM|nr:MULTISPECIES: alpha/beta hydrolase [Dasania]MCR8922160.1 alpha/beta hydrolase [Dasania sp. GY-MA-18]MCZ0864588.1 alpha/beta hydrolase [Dasania phycosphaerae]MCZ0868316.1 alpha/beta hydrolase [Dasania phycosphaerae]
MTEPTFNLDELLQTLPSFSLLQRPHYSQPVLDYFKYYGLDFENQFQGLQHYFGRIDCDPYHIACHYYVANDEAEAKTIVIVHGYYDHVGLYKHVIANCLEQGYNLIAFDLPGHGLSSGERTRISRFGEYQQVLKQLIALFNQQQITVNALLGQSTGAAIVMQYVLENPLPPKALVLLAPLFKPCQWRSVNVFYQIFKRFIKKLPRRFANNSQDKNFIYFLKYQDPLQARCTHLDWVGALAEWIAAFKYFKVSKNTALIVQGRDDSTVDWQNNITAIHKKLPNADIHYIDDAGHQLVNELPAIRDNVFTLINQYLRDQN